MFRHTLGAIIRESSLKLKWCFRNGPVVRSTHTCIQEKPPIKRESVKTIVDILLRAVISSVIGSLLITAHNTTTTPPIFGFRGGSWTFPNHLVKIVVTPQSQATRSSNIYLCCCFNIVTIYMWAGRSGDKIPVEVRFFASIQTDPGAHPASYTMGTGSFPEGKAAGAWR